MMKSIKLITLGSTDEVTDQGMLSPDCSPHLHKVA